MVTMDLAGRSACLSTGWEQELPKCTERGRQTAILCTDYRSQTAPLAAPTFAR